MRSPNFLFEAANIYPRLLLVRSNMCGRSEFFLYAVRLLSCDQLRPDFLALYFATRFFSLQTNLFQGLTLLARLTTRTPLTFKENKKILYFSRSGKIPTISSSPKCKRDNCIEEGTLFLFCCF